MAGYRDQVALLIQIIPEVEKVPVFALHGGTAINLFIRDMPRLSVDIDLTYINTEARETAMLNIRKGLATIKKNIEQNIPGVKVNFLEEQLKIQISKGGAVVKIEVNQGIRGLMNKTNELVLCERAQEDFDAFCSIQGVSLGQLYGGKICAALDRQHPRDLFDVHYMLENEGITNSIKEGFLFTLLSSARSMHDILFPNKLDQKATFENQFKGMTQEPFSYKNFEETRDRLLTSLHDSLTNEDKEFIVAFKNTTPNWDYLDFKKFPAVQWKLKNLLALKASNPKKHEELVSRLQKRLGI